MIPKKLAPGLDLGWEPDSRFRDAHFGGGRKVGKDHAQIKNAKRVGARNEPIVLALDKVNLGAGEGIRTLDPDLGKVVLYH